MQFAYHLILAARALMDVRHALMNIGNDDVGIQNKLGLEREKSATTKQRHTERTLKTWRSLFRSDFHAAIMSLSFLEWTNRLILWRPLRLSTFACISATVLGSGDW